MASVLFKKPPLTKLLKSIKPEVLDIPFTNHELGVIAGEVVEWEHIARGLGLTKGEIDNIRYDHHKNSKMQKSAMMRIWKEKVAFKATIRSLITISRTNGWYTWIHDVCIALDYLKPGTLLIL